MSEGVRVRIDALTDATTEDVVRIHLSGMGYSFNSRLGHEHLHFLYRRMAHDPSCYVGVAVVDGRVAGVVSGSSDASAFAARLMRTMGAAGLLRLAAKILREPSLIWVWWQGWQVAAPVRIDSVEVRAVLTAIVVDEGIQQRGIGGALVEAFEQYLGAHRITMYRLDTHVANSRAVAFYRSRGFREVARRAGSIVFVRELA